MTYPSLLDLLLAEPGLAVCGGLVLLFAFVAWRKLLEAAREDRAKTDAWWASRQQYRYRVSFITEDGSDLPVGVARPDPSSLSDDSPEEK